MIQQVVNWSGLVGYHVSYGGHFVGACATLAQAEQLLEMCRDRR